MKGGFALLTHPSYMEHYCGYYHPEQPSRLAAIHEELKKSGLWEAAVHIIPREAGTQDLLLCHTAEHIDRVQNAALLGRPLDPDTGTSHESWEAALRAVGAGFSAADAIAAGEIQTAFCAVRPPGHHATPERSMGFCLFNNIALCARYIQRHHGIKRVAIVDFDAHHGNGTQEIFFEDGSVFYASIHQWPLFPGTGDRIEIGRGQGKGTTLNCPVEAGSGMEEFAGALDGEILPALDGFGPDILLVSAGFDSHREDPLTDLGLGSSDFGRMTSILREFAQRKCGGRLISFLEGGYNLGALARSVRAHVKALAK